MTDPLPAEAPPVQLADLNKKFNRELKERNLPAALATARKIAELTPQSMPAHLRVAAVLMQHGKPEGAAAKLREVVALWPTSAEAHAALARVLLRLGKFGVAVDILQRATELEPTSADYHEQLGRALTEADRVVKAAKAMAKAAELAPESAPIHAALCRLLMRLGQAAEARAAGQKSLELDPAQPQLTSLLRIIRLPGEPKLEQDRTAEEGADGFLFYAADAAFVQMCGAPAEPRHVTALADVVTARYDWCAQHNIAYRMLIVPERHAVYDDYLPAGHIAQPERMAVRMPRALRGEAVNAVVYPYSQMRTGRAHKEVCLRQDVHWSSYGAYLSYRALLETLPALKDEILPEDVLIASTARRVGDMAYWLGLRTREVCEVLDPPKANMREVMSTKTFKPGQVDVLETDHPAGRRLVILRTSNTTALLPLLAHHFSRIVAMATTRLSYELLESEQPHFVFSELPERYLATPTKNGSDIILPRDTEGRSFFEETGCALPLPGAVSAEVASV